MLLLIVAFVYVLVPGRCLDPNGPNGPVIVLSAACIMITMRMVVITHIVVVHTHAHAHAHTHTTHTHFI